MMCKVNVWYMRAECVMFYVPLPALGCSIHRTNLILVFGFFFLFEMSWENGSGMRC